MRKHKTIRLLIDKINSEIGLGDLKSVDYWDSDLCAIGFRKQNKLLYVSSYNFINDKVIKYDYDLAFSEENDDLPDRVVQEGRAVTTDELIVAVKHFFEVSYGI